MNLISRIVIYLILLTSMGMAYNTLGIGVNVFNPLHSATFYHKYIYYGADFLHIGISATSIQETDYESGSGYDETDTNDGQASINLLMPRLGFRIPSKNIGQIQRYNQIEGYLIFPMLKTSGDLELDNDAEEQIKDALDLMGFKVSHSVQYNFTSQLSLVAEVGLNWIFWDSTQESENQYSSYTEKSENALSTNFSMTYNKLSLHFKLK